MTNKSIISYLNRHRGELLDEHKVTGYNKVFWANTITKEIYAHSTDEEILGSISGYKVADINDDWEIVPSQEG